MLNWPEYAAMKKILVVGLGTVAALAFWFAPQVPEPLLSSALAQSSESGPCVESNRLVLSLGIDDSEETDWSGTASGWVRDERASWSAESQSAPLKLAGGGQAPRVLPASADVNLPASPCGSAADRSRSVRVETGEGSFRPGRWRPWYGTACFPAWRASRGSSCPCRLVSPKHPY